MENLKFISPDEMKDRMVSHLTHETKLYYCGFQSIVPFYQFMLGNCTDITGYPYSGKTLFLVEMLYNLSVKYGIKHLLHLPDSGKPEEIMSMLIQKHTGKTYDQRYDNKFIAKGKDNEEHIVIHAMSWINEHFKILTYDQRPDPIEFWQYASSIDVQCASIDSWNYMRKLGSGTEYLADVLSQRNEIAENNNMHFFTIIHPRNPSGNDFDATGKLKPPDVYNLMGGSEWNNNGKNIISIHKESKESINYDVYFRKIKPRLVGSTGFCTMQYDITKQKFYELEHYERKYAFEGDGIKREPNKHFADNEGVL